MRILRLSLLSFLFLLIVGQVKAVEFMNGDTVTVPKGKVIDSSVVVTGGTLHVDGEVNGDLFCAGQDVFITGPVHGDVICAGQNVHVDNLTDGNVRVAAQTLDMNGKAGSNISLFGQTVTIGESAAVTGEMLFGAQTVKMQGIVGRDMHGWAQSIELNGEVDRNVIVDADSVHLGAEASVGGNVRYTSDHDALVAKNASISGGISRLQPTQRSKPAMPNSVKEKFRPYGGAVRGGVFLVTTLVLGAVFLLLFPKQLPLVAIVMREQWGQTAIRGLLTVVIVPLFLFILVLTIIGIPVVFLLGMGLIIAYFVGRILTTLVLGQLILERLFPDKAESMGWSLLIGALILWAVFTLPLIGGLASFLVTLFGFGGVTYFFFPSKASKK